MGGWVDGQTSQADGLASWVHRSTKTDLSTAITGSSTARHSYEYFCALFHFSLGSFIFLCLVILVAQLARHVFVINFYYESK